MLTLISLINEQRSSRDLGRPNPATLANYFEQYVYLLS